MGGRGRCAPCRRAAATPDVEAGLRFAFNHRLDVGARQQAYGQPGIGALAEFGVSGIYRLLRGRAVPRVPGRQYRARATATASSSMRSMPAIPAKSARNRGNALSITGEYSRGTGIADMYSDLTGGLLFPAAARTRTGRDSDRSNAPPVYHAQHRQRHRDVRRRQSGCARPTGRASSSGLQYYPADPRVVASGCRASYSQLKSEQHRRHHAAAGLGRRPTTGAWYYDGSLFVAITDAIQMGACVLAHRPDAGRRRQDAELPH